MLDEIDIISLGDLWARADSHAGEYVDWFPEDEDTDIEADADFEC